MKPGWKTCINLYYICIKAGCSQLEKVLASESHGYVVIFLNLPLLSQVFKVCSQLAPFRLFHSLMGHIGFIQVLLDLGHSGVLFRK